MYYYSVWSKDGSICLADRLTQVQAEEFCRHTTDFVNKNKKPQK